ncbi:glycosyltransferase [Heliobacterium gestii]|uniref:Glycosyltransferase n=1 Tax=Heliomicrobium gestii TaxID=2699 RepID=A0A845LDW3_HELGE|nr:glycosyltransferase family 4 protein [Heliomicrobium gestii]MBM7866600.1 glycosyltransferase involved in cell wall biosynthesis [Heliomicrobium gestii]MZP43120.1 glycosyltransferase [Heliomicrobium gestii]
MKRKNVVFVVQRYGKEVLGGSESLCRQIAERLAPWYDLQVVTTCASDYLTWQDEFPPGETQENGVLIRRFPVDHPRKKTFSLLNRLVYHRILPSVFERTWMKAQGPYSTQLLEYLESIQEKTDLFVYFTYLYGTTYYGLTRINKKSILVPMAHDEPPLTLTIFEEMFSNAQALLFLSEEEKQLVERRFNILPRQFAIGGIGIDLPEEKNRRERKKYLLYMGRLDAGKGVDQLFQYYEQMLKEMGGESPDLYLLGKGSYPVPEHPKIRSLGFVSEAEKWRLLHEAMAMVVFSRYESLSIVTLEALAANTPVLVNGHNPVLAGHCRRSQGGRCFYDCQSFVKAVNELVEKPGLIDIMGKSGREYVSQYYTWPTMIATYRALIDSVIMGNEIG